MRALASACASPAARAASLTALAAVANWCEFAPDSPRSTTAMRRSEARLGIPMAADWRAQARSPLDSVNSQSRAVSRRGNTKPGYSVRVKWSRTRSPGRSSEYTPAAVAR
ncbi:hypothetical protein SCYAM73S_07120 [Streptomyces cyaneofuscatus]